MACLLECRGSHKCEGLLKDLREYQAEFGDIARLADVCFLSSLYLSCIGRPMWDLKLN